jgi:hypothetical protein
VTRRLNRRAVAWIAGGAIWLAVVSAGLAVLMEYDTKPGAGATAPAEWPAESAVPRSPDGPTLVMLAHPRCDCTRASIGELAELLARARTRPRTYVVFIKPGGVSKDWEQTSLWQSAARIPGVTVLRDDDGVEAVRFGVETSGQTLLYDARGRLIFSGGATGARGKPGANVGRSALIALLNGDEPPRNTTPVFGCPLFGPGDESRHTDDHNHGAKSK